MTERVSYWLHERDVVRQINSPTFTYSGPRVEMVAVCTTTESAKAAFRLLATSDDMRRNRELGRDVGDCVVVKGT